MRSTGRIMTVQGVFVAATAAATLALVACASPPAEPAALSPTRIAEIVAAPDRTDADRVNDMRRKPAEMLAFSRVKAGDTVLELIPGGGYFTRLLSKAVGPGGQVLAASPSIEGMDKAAKAIAADARYANVKAVAFDAATRTPTPPVDVIFTAQNYHDLHLTRAKQDVPLLDKLFFAKLKSGGVLVVIDHAALAGAPVTETANTLHRIDPAAARAEIVAAGFVFDGQSDALSNPADPHTKSALDPSIRGKTDQFVYRFRKP